MKLKGNVLNFNSKSRSLTSNINPFRPNPGRREKNKLNFYFHTSLWCLKRFYEGLCGASKDFMKAFRPS